MEVGCRGSVSQHKQRCMTKDRLPGAAISSQRSLHSAPIFRLLLKVAVNGMHQCDFHNFCGALCSNCCLNEIGVVKWGSERELKARAKGKVKRALAPGACACVACCCQKTLLRNEEHWDRGQDERKQAGGYQ